MKLFPPTTLSLLSGFVALYGLTAMLPGPAHASDITIANFDAQHQASLNPGAEFPGGVVTQQWLAPGQDSPGVERLSFDFSAGGNYGQLGVGHYFPYFPSLIDAFIFRIRLSSPQTLLVRVADANGETFQTSVPCEVANAWTQVKFDLTDTTQWSHWGLNDNGRLEMPVTALSVGIQATPDKEKKGTFDLDEVIAVSPLTSEQLVAKEQRYSLTSQALGNTVYPGEAFTPRIAAVSPPRDIDRIPIQVRIFDARDTILKTLPIVLNRKDNFSAPLNVPTQIGFYRVGLEYGGQKIAFDERYAVLPKPPERNGKDPDSPFGINTHFNQGWDFEVGKLVKKFGISWIRDGEALLDDRAVIAARANNLNYLPVFTQYKVIDWAKVQRPDGTYDWSEVAEWHRQYAAKYRDDIDVYDLINEPNNGNWTTKFGGDWSGGEWLKQFTHIYAKQMTAALRAGDPTAKIMWEDIDSLLWYPRFKEYGVAEDIDIISPHPYNLHRVNRYPEEQPAVGNLPRYHRFVANNKLDWGLWSGEVGFSSFTVTPSTHTTFYPPYSELEQAQMLVRMLTVQLAGGVQKIFYYDMRNDGWEKFNPEHNFGIIRLDNQPKPAGVAYANFIDRFRHGKWAGRMNMQDTYVYNFVPSKAKTPVKVAWVMTGSKSVRLPVKAGQRECTVTDIFGAARKVAVKNGQLELTLTTSPLYIEGA